MRLSQPRKITVADTRGAIQKEFQSVQRQLRQRTAVYTILLNKMGGTTFEYDMLEDKLYFSVLDTEGNLEERLINHGFSFLKNNVDDGDEFVRRLQEYIQAGDHDIDDNGLGTVESRCRLFSDKYRWFR